MKISPLIFGGGMTLLALAYLLPMMFRPKWTNDDALSHNQAMFEYKAEYDKQFHDHDPKHQHNENPPDQRKLKKLKQRYELVHARMLEAQNTNSWFKSNVPWVTFTSNAMWFLGIITATVGLIAIKSKSS